MSPVDTQNLLMQMRMLAMQAQQKGVVQPPADGEAVAETRKTASAEPFSELLKKGVEAVNQEQQQAAELKKAFEMGEPDVELSQVMLQVQKASLSFEAMTQVRNKLVEAYKEVMNMPL